ncbi:MAG: hypothetical protein NTZ34_07110 [Chloroflexi bacterium]|nr:hypothetical protein [Chloroflexota bacterium]
MAIIDMKKWQNRTGLAVLLGLLVFILFLFVTPIYGFNITPQTVQGFANVGGNYGALTPVQEGYGG